MEKAMPKYLYQYRPTSKYSLENLGNKKIWMNSPSLFNDPFDVKGKFVELDFETVKRRKGVSIEDVVQHNDLAQKTFHQLLSSFLISCFVHDENNQGPTNQLMWAHYADCHKGFCIKYEVLKDKYEQGDSLELMPVEYPKTDRIPVFDVNRHEKEADKKIPPEAMDRCKVNDYKDMFEEIHSKKCLDAKREDILKIISTKHQRWKYENEYRLVLHPSDDYKNVKPKCIDFPSTRLKPVELTFGCRCDELDRHILSYCLKYAEWDLPLYECIPSDSKYELIHREVALAASPC